MRGVSMVSGMIGAVVGVGAVVGIVMSAGREDGGGRVEIRVCELRFASGAVIDGVRLAEDETARREGMRGVSVDNGGVLFRWRLARGRMASMEGMTRALDLAWLGPDDEVVGTVRMQPGGPRRYRSRGWTGGAIETPAGGLDEAGIGRGDRLVDTRCIRGADAPEVGVVDFVLGKGFGEMEVG